MDITRYYCCSVSAVLNAALFARITDTAADYCGRPRYHDGAQLMAAAFYKANEVKMTFWFG